MEESAAVQLMRNKASKEVLLSDKLCKRYSALEQDIPEPRVGLE